MSPKAYQRMSLRFAAWALAILLAYGVLHSASQRVLLLLLGVAPLFTVIALELRRAIQRYRAASADGVPALVGFDRAFWITVALSPICALIALAYTPRFITGAAAPLPVAFALLTTSSFGRGPWLIAEMSAEQRRRLRMLAGVASVTSIIFILAAAFDAVVLMRLSGVATAGTGSLLMSQHVRSRWLGRGRAPEEETQR